MDSIKSKEHLGVPEKNVELIKKTFSVNYGLLFIFSLNPLSVILLS